MLKQSDYTWQRAAEQEPCRQNHLFLSTKLQKKKENIKSPTLWLKSALLRSFSEPQSCSVSALSPQPPPHCWAQLCHQCTPAKPLMVWEEEITFFFFLPTITLALHSWFDFKRALSGCVIGLWRKRRWEKSLLGIWVNILSLDTLHMFGLGGFPRAGVFRCLEVFLFFSTWSLHPSFYLLRPEWSIMEPPTTPPIPANGSHLPFYINVEFRGLTLYQNELMRKEIAKQFCQIKELTQLHSFLSHKKTGRTKSKCLKWTLRTRNVALYRR